MKQVLFVNHSPKQCGVWSWGKRVSDILSKSTQIRFDYLETDSREGLDLHTWGKCFDVIVYNHHPLTMPWIGREDLQSRPNVKHVAVLHEGSRHEIGWHGHINLDCTLPDQGNTWSIPRPLFDLVKPNSFYRVGTRPVISSYGFGFGSKGFGRVVKTVNDQFDEAIIRLHIPFAYFGDREGRSVQDIHPGCWAEVKKPGIHLEITTDYKTDNQLLEWLAHSDLNIFLYDEMPGRGLSSVIDYALSVDVPLTISETTMFRHLREIHPLICYENRSLADIMQGGTHHLEQYRKKWSHSELIAKFEHIINQLSP